MAIMYYDKDANLDLLKGKKVAIIGYGSQGHAQGQNLRDSGVEVIVSELEGTDNYKLAEEAGFKPMDAAAAAKEAQVVQMLVPDTVQAQVYKAAIAENLQENDALVFSHGFNIHFSQILPAEYVDVFMVAPKGPGQSFRGGRRSTGAHRRPAEPQRARKGPRSRLRKRNRRHASGRD